MTTLGDKIEHIRQRYVGTKTEDFLVLNVRPSSTTVSHIITPRNVICLDIEIYREIRTDHYNFTSFFIESGIKKMLHEIKTYYGVTVRWHPIGIQ